MTTIDHYERAMRLCVNDTERWRALNRAAATLRNNGPIFQPYRVRLLRVLPRRARRLALRLARGGYR